MMHHAFLVLGIGIAGLCTAQVHVDKPIVLTGADPAARQVEGLAPADQEDALIDLAGARSGRYHWGVAGGTANAVTLAMDPPCAAYTTGLHVRFLPVRVSAGAVTLNVDGLGPKRIYRNDGLPVAFGELEPGRVADAIYVDTAFFLTARAARACPQGFLQVNDSYCLQQNDTLSTSIFSASRWCQDRGAQLCTWDQYLNACVALQTELQGLFDDWEWIDDTADHTHTAGQAGRWQCRSERSWGAAEHPNNNAQVRCCYRLR